MVDVLKTVGREGKVSLSLFFTEKPPGVPGPAPRGLSAEVRAPYESGPSLSCRRPRRAAPCRAPAGFSERARPLLAAGRGRRLQSVYKGSVAHSPSASARAQSARSGSGAG